MAQLPFSLRRDFSLQVSSELLDYESASLLLPQGTCLFYYQIILEFEVTFAFAKVTLLAILLKFLSQMLPRFRIL